MPVITFLILIVLISMLLGYAALIIGIPVLIFAIIMFIKQYPEMSPEQKKRVKMVGLALVIGALIWGVVAHYSRNELVSGGLNTSTAITRAGVPTFGGGVRMDVPITFWVRNDSWSPKYVDFHLTYKREDGSTDTTTESYRMKRTNVWSMWETPNEKIESGSTIHDTIEFTFYSSNDSKTITIIGCSMYVSSRQQFMRPDWPNDPSTSVACSIAP